MKDVIPPRPPGPAVLSALQSQNVRLSMQHLADLSAHWERANPDDLAKAHCVSYECAFSTLINNPKGVEHFVSTMKATSVGGVVDTEVIEGLALTADGDKAGHYVSVHAYVPL